MIDVRAVTTRDLLPIYGIEYAPGVSPLSVVVIGERFNETTQVLLNDIAAPEFIVASPSRLIAQVPDSERRAPLRKVVVLADTGSMKRSSLLYFETPGFRSVTGVQKLVQAFCKLLLQTPGSDKFRPNDGGGLLSLVGRNVTKGDTKSLQASVMSAVDRTRDQFLTRQARNTRIPADERLLTSNVEAVSFDPTTTTLSVRVEIVALSGRTAAANLTL